MVLQRRKAEHAALVSHEQETGGSDPLEPDFWDDELEMEEREMARIVSPDRPTFGDLSRRTKFTALSVASPSMLTTPPRDVRPYGQGKAEAMGTYRDRGDDDEDWAEEAAAAEEAEREAEELAMLDRVERDFMESSHQGGSGWAPGESGRGLVSRARGGGDDMEVDWDGFDQMDMT
jgi:hypothetical protein